MAPPSASGFSMLSSSAQREKEKPSSHNGKRDMVERVTQDPILHGSEALCSLLRYLVEHSLDAPQQPIKEYQIATEVFGRPPTFDPRLDSTVRVQTGRLRAKLGEYYSGTGADDPWHIEIPKGSYSVIFHEGPSLRPAAKASRRSIPAIPAAVGLTMLAIAVIVLLFVVFLRSPRAGSAGTIAVRKDAAVTQFWNTVLPHPDPPLVVFSNAEFVGRPETGLRYFQPERDTAAGVFDQYTGVGEVIAVHELDGLFEELGRPFILKRGRLLNWDDTKNRDLIFVGSPSENLPVRELPLNKDFVFKRFPGPPRPGDLGIVNLRPRPGEQAVYFGSKGLPITDDYALIEVSAGTGASQRMLVAAGTTTFGTQGAVEFVCREDKVANLLNRLGRGHKIGRMSALLHVKIQGGVPLDSDIVALRKD